MCKNLCFLKAQAFKLEYTSLGQFWCGDLAMDPHVGIGLAGEVVVRPWAERSSGDPDAPGQSPTSQGKADATCACVPIAGSIVEDGP